MSCLRKEKTAEEVKKKCRKSDQICKRKTGDSFLKCRVKGQREEDNSRKLHYSDKREEM